MKWIFLCLVFSFNSFASKIEIANEETYLRFKAQIYKANVEKNISALPLTLNSTDQKLFVDSLEDYLFENKISNFQISKIVPINFSVIEKLRLEILKLKYYQAQTVDILIADEVRNELRRLDVDNRIVYTIAIHEKLLLAAGSDDIVEIAKLHSSYSDIAQVGESDEDIVGELASDLFYNSPIKPTLNKGKLSNTVKIFMFCRKNRLYPCLMVMRDIEGNEVRNQDGTLWSHPVLASAKSGFPSYQRNGNTPAGIFLIDSVMPYADQQLSYGKYRRMMLDFVPKTENEMSLKSFLPKSSWENKWWMQSVVARDVGRNLFRIHGSGRTNDDPNSTFYPFMQTNGCIANRENTYNGVTYNDQRKILDSIMLAMKLEANYENESKIKGILYLLEINDKAKAVSINDLNELGIR